MKRITLLIDVLIEDSTISRLQEMLHDEPLVDIEVRRSTPPGISMIGRFIGAQEARGSE